MRLCARAAAFLACVVPAAAQSLDANAPGGQVPVQIEERDLFGSGATAGVGRSMDEWLAGGGIGANKGGPAPDVSLAAPPTPQRLTTPIDAASVEQRIDKGLTAAGERSAFPPAFAYGAFQRGYFLTAFSLALDRAKSGDPAAQTLLGELLSRGLGVKQDLAAAIDWYRLAAKSGDAEALYTLGGFYLEGAHVGRDTKQAADLLEQAARKGHAIAAREFGYLLLKGDGRERNDMLAAAYFRRAARLGDMDAQYALAGLYVEGIGVVADEAQAVRWYNEAARNGHVGAQVEYAIMLFNGRGVQANEAAAASWFREAANAGNPVAQVRLARILADGRRVEKEPTEAAKWYLIAKSGGIEDEFLDGWLLTLDAASRDAATRAAERWAGGSLQTAQAEVEQPPGPAAIDKRIE